jgi:hypothetical protein
MSANLMIVLSMIEPALLVVILGVGLTAVANRLTIISDGLGTLGGALATVESLHLRPLDTYVADINGPLKTMADALPVIASTADFVVKRATGG